MKAVSIRHIVPSDWVEVMDIERLSFEDPWLEIDFRRTLQRRTVDCLIADVGDEVVGYVVYERLGRNLVLLNIAVHPKYRRNGVGGELATRLKARVSFGRTRIIADVSEYAVPAQIFLRREGFLRTETIHDYFGDERDSQDFYRMEWLPGGDDDQ